MSRLDTDLDNIIARGLEATGSEPGDDGRAFGLDDIISRGLEATGGDPQLLERRLPEEPLPVEEPTLPDFAVFNENLQKLYGFEPPEPAPRKTVEDYQEELNFALLTMQDEEFVRAGTDEERLDRFNELRRQAELDDVESLPPDLRKKDFLQKLDQAFVSGLSQTSPGLLNAILGGQGPIPPPKGKGFRILSEIVSIAADPVTYAGFGVGGVVSRQILKKIGQKFVGRMAARGATTGVGLAALTGVREPLAQKATTGRVDWSQAALETGKAGVLGLGAGAVGTVPVAGLPLEIGAFAAGGAALEARKPTLDDLINATGVILGLRLTGYVTKLGKVLFREMQGEELTKAERQVVKDVPTPKRQQILQEAIKRVEEPIRPEAAREQPPLEAPRPQPVTAEPARVETVKPEMAPKPQATSIKNAVVDQERAARGLPVAMEPARRSFGEVWDEAMRVVDQQPSKQDALIAELTEKSRPVSDLEDALLLHRQISLQNEYDKAVAQHSKAGDVATVASLESQQQVLLQELLQLYDIGKAVGTATSRGLNARKMLAAEDFSLVRMIGMKRTAKGVSQLSEQDTNVVKEAQRTIEGLERQLQEHTERITQLEAEHAMDRAVKEMKASESAPRQKTRSAKAQAELDAAWKDFSGRVSGRLYAVPLDPALLGSAVRLAKAYVNAGVVRFQDFVSEIRQRIGKREIEKHGDVLARAWDRAISEETPRPAKAPETRELFSREAQRLAKFFVSTGVTEREALIDRVHAELAPVGPGLTRRNVMDAISGYGQYRALGKDDLSTLLRDLKGQMQQIAKLEDMQAGQAPLKTGIERRAPSDEERRLIQQVNQMKKQEGYDVADPETQLRSALDAVKIRLRNQITDLEHQVATKERIVKQRADVPQDKEVQELAKRRDSLREQFDEVFGKEITEEQRLRAAIASTKRSIAEYERRITARDFEGRRPKSKIEVNAELQALQDRRDALKAEWTELRNLANPKKSPEERALSALKTRLRTRTAEYQDRLTRKDFGPKVRRETVLDKEAENLRFQAEEAKRRFLQELEADARQRRTVQEKIWAAVPEFLRTTRSIKTSFDLSAVGRQGGIVNFGHPVRGARGIANMFRAFGSKAEASRAQHELENRPNAALYKRARLELTDPEGRLSQQEEVYMARWSKMIPGVAGSERAYVTYLNRLRADTFDEMAVTLGRTGTLTESEAKVIANYVNAATGRGDLGKFKGAAVPLATVFFAPRFVLSRFQYLTFQPLRMKGGTPRTRKLIALEYARTLSGLGLVLSTAAFALWARLGLPGNDKEWNIELDPRSSDFGKIRIGNTRIDPLFGLQQVTVLLGRLLTGRTKQIGTGLIVPIRGEKVPYGRATGAEVVGRFMRTKLAPAIGTSLNVLAGENLLGEPITNKTVAEDLVMPISLQDIGPLMRKHGFTGGTVLALLEIFGTTVQHYDEGDATDQLKRERYGLRARRENLDWTNSVRLKELDRWYSRTYLAAIKRIRALVKDGNEEQAALEREYLRQHSEMFLEE